MSEYLYPRELFMTPKHVLVAEDDDNFFEPMELYLETRAAERGANIVIHRATTRNDALILMRTTEFIVVSTDMGMPLMHQRPIEKYAGASLCRYALLRSERYKAWKHLMIFSLLREDDIKEALAKEDVAENAPRYPAIFHKSSIELWAQALVEKCLE